MTEPAKPTGGTKSALAHWLIGLLADFPKPHWLIGLLAYWLIISSCANIVPPSGGKKDTTPPKLLSVSPRDSQLNARVTKVELRFNEFITLDNPAAQVQLSPLLPFPLTVTAGMRTVTVKIPDSLLLANTTYHLSFGGAIKDVHEGNAFANYSYLFSTGPYFDSLQLHGQVINAASGLADTAATVLLYDAAAGDSAVVRRKPLYAVHTDGTGAFLFAGLPQRRFRLYALRDANANLTFDGGPEWIAYSDSLITPQPDTMIYRELRSFPEASADTAANAGDNGKLQIRKGAANAAPAANAAGYRVLADTSDLKQRTQDITGPLLITFPKKPSAINAAKIFLSTDSAGITAEQTVNAVPDTSNVIRVSTPWQENTVYTLRLQKGFAQDSAGADYLPGRYTFRTKRSGDYAQLSVHLTQTYQGKPWLLQVLGEQDTILQKPVTDSMVVLRRLQPGTYTVRLICDENGDGHWTTGDLLGHRQPELVVPYETPQSLKAGWEHTIDFAPPKPKSKDKGSRLGVPKTLSPADKKQ